MESPTATVTVLQRSDAICYFATATDGFFMALISQVSPSYCLLSKGIQIQRTLCWLAFLSLELFKDHPDFTFGQCRIRDLGCKQGHLLNIAASRPTGDAAIAMEPLVKEDLVGYLASRYMPKEEWRFVF